LLTRDAIQSRLEAAIAERSTLPAESLRQYAAQYYHFELAFPTFLSAVHSRTPSLAVRQEILSNIWDEEYGPNNHTALWLRFCNALGVATEEVEATPLRAETARLIDTYRGACGTGHYSKGLAALLAYEAQVPAVSEQKIAGLKAFYGIDRPHDIAFFKVHMEADVTHSATERDLVIDGAATAEQQDAALAAADQALDALWGFLDGVYQMEPAKA
jgi:pyrroloquinoline-quinone synthase